METIALAPLQALLNFSKKQIALLEISFSFDSILIAHLKTQGELFTARLLKVLWPGLGLQPP